jgi:hypothetical protein
LRQGIGWKKKEKKERRVERRMHFGLLPFFLFPFILLTKKLARRSMQESIGLCRATL